MRGFTKSKKKHMLKIQAVYPIGNPEICQDPPSWGQDDQTLSINCRVHTKKLWNMKWEINTIFPDKYSFCGQNRQKELQFIVNVYSNWKILLWCKGQITLVESKKSSKMAITVVSYGHNWNLWPLIVSLFYWFFL